MGDSKQQELIDEVDDLQIQAKYGSHSGTYYLTTDSIEKVVDLIRSHTAKAVLEARIQEREHTWQLINDIRYQNVSLDFAKNVSLERLSNAQVDQQLEAEAALQQRQKDKS